MANKAIRTESGFCGVSLDGTPNGKLVALLSVRDPFGFSVVEEFKSRVEDILREYPYRYDPKLDRCHVGDSSMEHRLRLDILEEDPVQPESPIFDDGTTTLLDRIGFGFTRDKDGDIRPCNSSGSWRISRNPLKTATSEGFVQGITPYSAILVDEIARSPSDGKVHAATTQEVRQILRSRALSLEGCITFTGIYLGGLGASLYHVGYYPEIQTMNLLFNYALSTGDFPYKRTSRQTIEDKGEGLNIFYDISGLSLKTYNTSLEPLIFANAKSRSLVKKGCDDAWETLEHKGNFYPDHKFVEEFDETIGFPKRLRKVDHYELGNLNPKGLLSARGFSSADGYKVHKPQSFGFFCNAPFTKLNNKLMGDEGVFLGDSLDGIGHDKWEKYGVIVLVHDP